MHETLLIFFFSAGYAAIAFEARIGVNKVPAALLAACGCWILDLSYGSPSAAAKLAAHLADISQVILVYILKRPAYFLRIHRKCDQNHYEDENQFLHFNFLNLDIKNPSVFVF